MSKPNRIENAIATTAESLKTMDPDTVIKLGMSSLLSPQDYSEYHRIKCVGYRQGWVTGPELGSIRKYLGNDLTIYDKQPLEVKITLVRFFHELLKTSETHG